VVAGDQEYRFFAADARKSREGVPKEALGLLEFLKRTDLGEVPGGAENDRGAWWRGFFSRGRFRWCARS
jgi:hypothetical protein